VSLRFQTSDEVDRVLRGDRLGFKAALILLLALGTVFGIVGWLRGESLNTIAKSSFEAWAVTVICVWGVLPIYFEFRARAKEIYGMVSTIEQATIAANKERADLLEKLATIEEKLDSIRGAEG
jgi:hypothetical protein